MRTPRALAGLALATTLAGGLSACAAPPADPAGQYARTTPAPGRLAIASAGPNLWRLTLSGGGRPDGAATGADCVLEAEAALQGGVLRGRVTSSERPATISVRLSGEEAEVSTNYQGCGVGVDLNGVYGRQRAEARALAVGDDLARAQAAYPDSRLRIVEGYPWAKFAVLRDGRPIAVLTFDGENEELSDGSNSFRRIGDTVDWTALKPALKVTRIEKPAS